MPSILQDQMEDIKKKAINKIDWGNRYVCALIIINSH